MEVCNRTYKSKSVCDCEICIWKREWATRWATRVECENQSGGNHASSKDKP